MAINCEDIRDELSEFVDGTLPADRAASINAHLSGCAACAALARDLDRIRAWRGKRARSSRQDICGSRSPGASRLTPRRPGHERRPRRHAGSPCGNGPAWPLRLS